MSRNITPIASTDTVEEWFDKTNLMIDAIQDAVTIGDAEINTGNVVLSGNITALEVNVGAINVADEINNSIEFNAALLLESPEENPIRLNNSDTPNADGQKISFDFQNTKRWEIGVLDQQYASFGIKNVDRNYSLTVTTNESGTGTMSGTNVTIDKSLLPTIIDSNTTGDAGTCTKWKTPRIITFETGDVTGEFTLDGSQNVQNVVLNVKDNSHRHEISNVEGLFDELNAKQNTDAALNSITQLGDQFGILVRTSATQITPKVIAPGDGIAITNGGGVSGTPTIAHAQTSTITSPENTGSTFIQNLGFDKFGHVTTIASAKVPVSTTYVSGLRAITGGASADIAHGLGARPFMVEGFLICEDADAGYAVGDMINLASTATTDVTVYANTTKIGFRCKNIVDIKVVNTQGQLVSIANTKWKLVIKGVL